MRALSMFFLGTLLVACAAAADPMAPPPSPGDRFTTGGNAQAIEFIPEDWRDRIRPIRSVRLSDACADLREIGGTPAGTARQAFLYQCGSVPQFAMGGEQALHWLDANSLEEISTTVLPHMFWRSQIALRDGQAFAYFEGAPIHLLSSSGHVTYLLLDDTF